MFRQHALQGRSTLVDLQAFIAAGQPRGRSTHETDRISIAYPRWSCAGKVDGGSSSFSALGNLGFREYVVISECRFIDGSPTIVLEIRTRRKQRPDIPPRLRRTTPGII